MDHYQEHTRPLNMRGSVHHERVPAKPETTNILATGHKPTDNLSNGHGQTDHVPSLATRHSHTGARDPKRTNAYLVGGGIASLAAACHLIQDANVPGPQIHILESGPLPGGSMDAAGDPEHGYIFRGGRMLNFSYLCLYELLSTVPSLADPEKSVMTEINEFNAVPGNKTHANARLVTRGSKKNHIDDASDFELELRDKTDLLKIMMEPEHSLGEKSISECFRPEFRLSNFWYMWATMFAFQPWHSAVEFRRYLHRFFHEFSRIDTLEGVDRTPYNQYDSIISPITKYLELQGVEFRYDTTALSLSYASGDLTTVEEIHIKEGKNTGIIHVHAADIVIITLGSMTANSSLGTNLKAPPPYPRPSKEAELDRSWALWNTISKDRPNFGNPSNFFSRSDESSWESFTVTLRDPDFFHRLVEFSHNSPGTGALTTFKSSNWIMSIVVPHQPHFIGQPEGVYVIWGYGLLPLNPGNYVGKPMTSCTGEEIMTELLGHLSFPTQPILSKSITIPCTMPYITSQFLTRKKDDRPQVIPGGSTNLAFVGQFVEIPLDVVFTVEYSVRGAQMAVFELMGLSKTPKKVFKGEHNLHDLAEAAKTFFRSSSR